MVPILTRRDIEEAFELRRLVVTCDELLDTPNLTIAIVTPIKNASYKSMMGCANNLGLSLGVTGVIIEQVPMTSSFRIMLPKAKRQVIRIGDVLTEKLIEEHQDMSLPILLGVGLDNKPLMVDLADAPHVLIAGATSGGKSVLLHSILYSLLSTQSPQQLRVMLVDPKGSEFTPYHGIPHMVGTEDGTCLVHGNHIVRALSKVYEVMNIRYAKFSELGARNIAEYNLMVPTDERYFRIVIVIDELGDLMSGDYKGLTSLYLHRLAQKCRAAGIHIVAATQRPTVKVVTGDIKANFPLRISLKVVSGIDSKVILDRTGAEKLLGKGDLFALLDGELVRAQCPFLSVSDIELMTTTILNQEYPVDDMDLSTDGQEEESVFTMGIFKSYGARK